MNVTHPVAILGCALALTLTLPISAIGAEPPTPEAATENTAKTLPDGRAILPCETPPKGMACIPGGAFIRGRDDGPKNEAPQATIWLQTFYIDIYEARVEDYEGCVAEGRCDRARTIYKDYSRPKQPKVGVSWHDSVKFCAVNGKTLPTEAQWERAARGTDGRLYPWGSEVATCDRAVIMNAKRKRSCGVKKRFGHPEKGRTFEVGTRPATQYGLFDMSGNSWEWVWDWSSKSYETCGEGCTGVDPKGPCDGAARCKGYRRKVVRGGSWYWPAKYATTTWRREHVPSNDPYHHFGFRCSATWEQARALTAKRAGAEKVVE